MIRTPRCLLFVPAHVERMLAKAPSIAVDAFVLDLEDAVPVARKDEARQAAARHVGVQPGRCFVRINPLNASTPYSTACGERDVAGIVVPGLRGVVLPKAESAADVERCDAAIGAAERRAGLPAGSVELHAIVESAAGVQACASIARARVRRPYRLCFGAGDFTTDIGVAWTRDEQESRVARSLLVIASRAAGLPQPVDSVFTDISDPEGLDLSARVALQLGFCGKFAIHPSQVEPVSRVFTPDADAVQWAREVLDGLGRAERAGEGAFVVRGKMVDYPIVEQARRLLERWEDTGRGTA